MDDVTQSLTEADAAHVMAIRAAEGVGVPQDWKAALDYLERSALLGSRLAQAELAGLSGRWVLAHEILAGEAVAEPWWSRFRSDIDLAKWLEPARRTMISEGPRMAIVKRIAEPEVCDWLIARARPKLKPALIYDDKTGQTINASARTNSLSLFSGQDSDLVLAILRTRIAGVTEMRMRAMETPKVLHYSLGEEFKPHFDASEDPNSPGYRHRVLTFLVALNDDYEGGATVFPVANGRWKGRRGGALFFWNLLPDGALDRRTLHAGRPVTRGEKWLLSQWISQPPEGSI